MTEVVVSLFIIIFGLLSMIFTTGLCVYHTSLIKNNLTTKEELKHVFKPPFGNPFLRSLSRNIAIALCPRISNISLLSKMSSKILNKKPDRSKLVNKMKYLIKFSIWKKNKKI